jgi:hypothetical protein
MELVLENIQQHLAITTDNTPVNLNVPTSAGADYNAIHLTWVGSYRSCRYWKRPNIILLCGLVSIGHAMMMIMLIVIVNQWPWDSGWEYQQRVHKVSATTFTHTNSSIQHFHPNTNFAVSEFVESMDVGFGACSDSMTYLTDNIP